jgi:hypothetical protein
MPVAIKSGGAAATGELEKPALEAASELELGRHEAKERL